MDETRAGRLPFAESKIFPRASDAPPPHSIEMDLKVLRLTKIIVRFHIPVIGFAWREGINRVRQSARPRPRAS
jgi:hypothetical protein